MTAAEGHLMGKPMGRFIVIILDSFGIGAMADVADVRRQDIGANTAFHIIRQKPDIRIPTLEKLGLMNAIGESYLDHRFSDAPNWGVANLAHFGADSFLGHQEIMGTQPKLPLIQPFSEKIDQVEAQLKAHGHEVRRVGEPGEPCILAVDDCATVGDNLETDPGQVYNVTGCLDLLSFDALKQIGLLVREVVEVSRVITFGGERVSFADLLAARKVKEPVAGVDAPESGVYRHGYQVVHLGYGIDPNTQVPTILDEAGLYVSLFGKVADIVQTSSPHRYPGVDSAQLLEALYSQVQIQTSGFFCLNIQETDVAGHLGDVAYYADRLEVCDRGIAKLLPQLTAGDILIVTADHGNDPTIGHSNHTRERVPLLVYSPGISNRQIGERDSLADIGATAAAYFGVCAPQHGSSFLECIL